MIWRGMGSGRSRVDRQSWRGSVDVKEGSGDVHTPRDHFGLTSWLVDVSGLALSY